MDKTIYELDLHEILRIDKFNIVMRVPNGWNYRTTAMSTSGYITTSATFVPYHKEFLPKENKPKKEKKNKPKRILQIYFQFIVNGLLPKEAWYKANSFWNYYESNGWKVSGKPMKSWTAAVNGTWTKDFLAPQKFQRDNLILIATELVVFYKEAEEEEYMGHDVLMIKKQHPELFHAYNLPDNWAKKFGNEVE